MVGGGRVGDARRVGNPLWVRRMIQATHIPSLRQSHLLGSEGARREGDGIESIKTGRVKRRLDRDKETGASGSGEAGRVELELGRHTRDGNACREWLPYCLRPQAFTFMAP